MTEYLLMELRIAFMTLMIAVFVTAENGRWFGPGNQMRDDVAMSWQMFKRKYNRQYNSQHEENTRHELFDYNVDYINSHNLRYKRGLYTYYLAPNQFADRTEREIEIVNPPIDMSRSLRRANINFHRTRPSGRRQGRWKRIKRTRLPTRIDWRDFGIVSGVKYQGNCGSCWAFTAIAVLEIQNIRRVGKLTDLSEQQLIDCSKGYGNHGCDGGFIDPSFHYIRDNRGINTDRSYPYEGKEGRCRYNPYRVGAIVTKWMDVDTNSEHKLQETVARVGPVAAAFDGRQRSFRYYRGGVYVENNCTQTVLDHSGVIVGYGHDYARAQDYWIIKNSWGKGWGEEGYIRFARNRDNMCGIASLASYPLVF